MAQAKNESTIRSHACPSGGETVLLTHPRVALPSHQFGASVEGRPIRVAVFNEKCHHTVTIFGGFHGDEPKSVHVCQAFINMLTNGESQIPLVRWVIAPLINPDGYEIRNRRNAHKVDLNRNFPPPNWAPGSKRSRMFGGLSPASEPETKVVIKLIDAYPPDVIITMHSISGHRFCNNYDGPSRHLATAMQQHNHYPVTASIGYPTPGSFGHWAGVEKNIPTITLELPSHHSAKRCWQDNCAALLAVASVGL